MLNQTCSVRNYRRQADLALGRLSVYQLGRLRI